MLTERRVLGLILVATLCFFLRCADAQQSPVSFSYGDMKFMVTPLDDQFCATVPNPSSMTMLSVSDWKNIFGQDCSENTFAGYVLLSVLASFVLVVAAIFFGVLIFPCACFLRYKFGLFGGGRRSRIDRLKGLITPNLYDVEGHEGYSREAIVFTKLAFGVLFVLLLIGGGAVIGGTTMTSHFVWQAKSIFQAYPAYHIDTTTNVQQGLASLPFTSDPVSQGIAEANIALAQDFKSTGDSEIIDKLDTLNSLLQAAFYATVGIAYIVILVGAYTAVFKLGRLAIILAFALTFLSALVWLEFSFVYGANNIIDKMCQTIARCHFCVDGRYPAPSGGCHEYCNVLWFDAMKECLPATSARYRSLEFVVNVGINGSGNAICQNIAALCTNFPSEITQCIYPNGQCDPIVVGNVGLTGLVTVQVNHTLYMTVPALVQNPSISGAVRELANSTVSQENNVFTSYQQLLTQAQSLDPKADPAFIESIPDGTYNRLQQHLCPGSPDDDLSHQYDLQKIISVLGAGLILIGVTLPFLQIMLCLGEKRWARGARKHVGGVEDEALIDTVINSSWKGAM